MTTKVLVVDDSMLVRALLRRQLSEQGHAVVEAVDGEDALCVAATEMPDIVLLDVEMPELDGHAVLRRMRERPETADIPVVFLTARATTEDVVEGLRLGAHDYLRKPFEPAELLARVSAALRVKKLQDELRRRNEELDALSRTDVLTGLPNRRHLLDRLEAETSAARRHDRQLAVLMADVDHFKSVNDTYGHDAGDAVLKSVAQRIADACRAEDVAGRWGGEELVVIAPSTDLPGAVALAEHIRAAVADTPIRIDASRSIDVTLSIGVVVGSEDPERLLRNVDVAVYTAKGAGRNQVCVGVSE